MKLSPAAELAVRGTIVLAQEYGNGPVTLQTVCTRRSLPKQYLIKIFASLSKAGLINSIRGKRGGFTLARDPGQISLLQIIEAVEGPMALNCCQEDPVQCDNDDCPFRPVWTELQQAFASKLGSMTLAHCVRTGRESPPPAADDDPSGESAGTQQHAT